MNNLYPILGYVGAFAYLLAYFLLSINKIKADQPIYHALNIVGAIGLTINAIYFADPPNVIVNLVWGLIAVTALIVLLRKRKKRN
jgi:hypothetical protein